MKKHLFLLVFALILSGCTNSVSNTSKPNDVSQDIWNEGIQYTIKINEAFEAGENSDDGFQESIMNFIRQDESNLSENEKDILENVSQLNIDFLSVGIPRLLGEDTRDAEKKYAITYKEVEKLFGANNLKESNYDESFFNTMVEEQKVKSNEKKQNDIETFKKLAEVTRSANEVQYNMPNNLDEVFYIEGQLEICDYYNYGFTNETNYFCGRLTPTDGGYSNSWYLYFHRKSFENVYNILMNNPISDIKIAAKVPSSSYQSGQGNMASVVRTQGKN
ncbi:membrane lipoprotein lipid attachment site-containing protein [Peribacillus simplex]|uniref:membrane lipoprotein lipid attachment site-containing protein n=1 Tax=Peribacillus simplex TaxID=1478 RepID=UPI003D2E76B8